MSGVSFQKSLALLPCAITVPSVNRYSTIAPSGAEWTSDCSDCACETPDTASSAATAGMNFITHSSLPVVQINSITYPQTDCEDTSQPKLRRDRLHGGDAVGDMLFERYTQLFRAARDVFPVDAFGE